MKLVINYDFIDKIKDVNENYGVMKIVRNRKRYLVFHLTPLCIAVDLPICLIGKESALIVFVSQAISYFMIEYFAYRQVGDFYKEMAINKLHRLVTLLKDININTSYDLLLKAEVYEKKYKIHLNEDKILEIIESKYILIPTYNYYGEVRDTSILEEHVIGSNDYILSLGSPEKKLKLVYANLKV